MSEETRMILEVLGNMNREMNQGFAEVHEGMDLIRKDLSETKEEVKVLKTDVAELKGEVKVLKADVAELKGKVKVLTDDVTELKGKVQVLTDDVTDLKDRTGILENSVQSVRTKVDRLTLIVENDINRKIGIVAEGHSVLWNELKRNQEFQRDKERMALDILDMRMDIRDLKRVVGIA